MTELDNTPTAELRQHIGERYQAPEINPQVQRRYARRIPAIDYMLTMGSITHEQHEALERLTGYIAGSMYEPGLTASYGDQRWTGTTAAQEAEPMIVEDWKIYCGQKVEQVRKAIDNETRWGVIDRVCRYDMSLAEAGRSLGYSARHAQHRASKHFRAALPSIVAHYRWHSLQLHPAG